VVTGSGSQLVNLAGCEPERNGFGELLAGGHDCHLLTRPSWSPDDRPAHPTHRRAAAARHDPTPFGAPTKVLVNGQPADTPRGDGPLSLREVQVLQLVAGGQTNRDIASRLFISENTVKTHLQKIFERLGTRDRAETVAVALRRGIIR
jgi:DNA-binding CsgD family transcriptional regulator